MNGCDRCIIGNLPNLNLPICRILHFHKLFSLLYNMHIFNECNDCVGVMNMQVRANEYSQGRLLQGFMYFTFETKHVRSDVLDISET